MDPLIGPRPFIRSQAVTQSKDKTFLKIVPRLFITTRPNAFHHNIIKRLQEFQE